MKKMTSNIYNRVHFMVCETNGHNINNLSDTILDMVNKIRKETLNESSR
jgi:hypothetical protein